ncbi:MAG TPA: preprotein translocase subunit SecE [Candidatus Saccharimonadales bacterium]|nr:preprotein translocase subunit SecE [Candidatus Saccharimonadales bacterium]
MDPSQPSRKKRRLRAPAETVREKAEKAGAEAQAQAAQDNPHRLRKFFSFIFSPLRWLSHKPPLKQIGHGLRWFFTRRFMRFLGRLLGLRYLRDSWRELKLVAWPSRRQSRQLTFAVIIFSVIFGGLIAIVDYGLDKLFKHIILK